MTTVQLRVQFDAVLTNPCKEHTMTKPHPHAHLMALYAQDAAETDTPWERWEYRLNDFQPWVRLNDNPRWSPSFGYRRKPKTIKVNGFDVPEPLDKVEVGTTIYIASPGTSCLYVMVPYTFGHSLYFDRKIVHATEEAAVAHAKAMLGIDPEGTV